MELKYVGAKPMVSSRGVTFDQSRPDNYTFLNATVELLEALSFEPTEQNKLYLHNVGGKEYDGRELVDLLKKHCSNLDDVFATREEKTTQLIENLVNRVKENKTINDDERRAWLGNISIMRDYYLQFVTNESAYKCALNALANKIHKLHVTELSFPLGRNHGLVLSHLIQVLSDHKPPYDAELSFEEKNGETLGKLNMNRPPEY